MKTFIGMIAFVCFVVMAHAEAPKFQAGDRVCFIGDSITHGGFNYHNQVVLFYATRFPQMRFDFWNCGISGDSADGANRRYGWDIAPHKPTVATIMLGMNDVYRNLYARYHSGPNILKQRQDAIDLYAGNLDKLAERLSKDGARVIFITPSLYDQTGTQKGDPLFGVNDALKACAAACGKLAVKYKGGLIDFNAPMEAINKEGQAKNPTFSLIGDDRVHPGPVGHLVMAYLFLKAQGMTPVVASLAIDAARGVVHTQENCEITGLLAGDSSVRFDCLEKSLPFPVADDAAGALELVPFIKDLNQETLRVSGLAAGQYEILIDSQSVLQVSASALAEGVNLAIIKDTPQHRQAAEVFKLLNQRADIVGNKLRVFAEMQHGFLGRLKNRSPESDKKAVEAKLAEMRIARGPYSAYYIGVYETYLRTLPEQEVLTRRAAELLDEAYKTAQPKSHRYEIRPLR